MNRSHDATEKPQRILLPLPKSELDHEHLVQMGLRFESEAGPDSQWVTLPLGWRQSVVPAREMIIRVGQRRRGITIAPQIVIVDERGIERARIVSGSPPYLSPIPDVGATLAWECLSEGTPIPWELLDDAERVRGVETLRFLLSNRAMFGLVQLAMSSRNRGDRRRLISELTRAGDTMPPSVV